MTKAEEKAKELIEKFMDVYPHRGMSKNAAIICVDKMIEEHTHKFPIGWNKERLKFWQQVKQFISNPEK